MNGDAGLKPADLAREMGRLLARRAAAAAEYTLTDQLATALWRVILADAEGEFAAGSAESPAPFPARARPSGPVARTLGALRRAPRPLTAHEVAVRMGCGPNTALKRLGILRAQGLVERAGSGRPHDPYHWRATAELSHGDDDGGSARAARGGG